MILRRIIFCLLCCTSWVAGAQQITPRAEANSVRIQRIDNPQIHIDGKLNEPVWQTLIPITEFVQTQPNLGQPASEKTEVMTFYDERNIYFGFRCYDSEPHKIVARLGAHDGRTNSDSVNILIDTFHDRRTGYFFSINSRGIQYDALANEGNGRTGFEMYDSTWDGIWYSAASVEDWGWSAEVVIPFKSIRLARSSEQVWGLNLSRDIVRKNESAYWVAVTRFDEVMKPSKAGVMAGLENVQVGRNMELIPFVSSAYRRSDWAPELQGASGNAGLDARYGLSANLTANLAVNPDFADTEADEFTSEISRFEIFFPEKRKFFTEGANYFQTPMDLFFSRRVGARLPDGEPQRILQGGKITGKSGPWTIGALEALTQDRHFLDPAAGLRKFAPGAFFGVLRLQHDVLQKSAIGFISVNRFQGKGDIGQGENSQAVDFQFLHGEHISWSSQVVLNTSSAFPGLDLQHLGGQTDFVYNSEKFEYHTFGKLLGRQTDLSNTGFEPETDRWSGQMSVTYKPFINRYGIRQIFVTLNYDESNGTQGELQDAGADAGLRVQFKNFWTLEAEHNYNRVRFNQFAPGFVPLEPTQVYQTPRYEVSLSTNENRLVVVQAAFSTGKMVQFDEKFYGFAKSYQLTTGLRLGDHMRWDIAATRVSESLSNGAHYQDRDFVVSRTTYQFTPKMRARVLAQYANGIHGHNINISSLLAYDFTARSALFLGYNRQRHSLLDPSDLGDQLFIKLSYLFAF